MTQGVFMKLFRLLEDTCHQFDLQLAYTYQEESSSSSSFTKYTEELHKLQVAKAKLAEAQDSLAALEEAVKYVVVAYREDRPVTDILIRHALDRRQSVEKMMKPSNPSKCNDFGGVFVGNHIHMTLQPANIKSLCSSMVEVTIKCPTLITPAKEACMKFTNIFTLLGQCHRIYDNSFIEEELDKEYELSSEIIGSQLLLVSCHWWTRTSAGLAYFYFTISVPSDEIQQIHLATNYDTAQGLSLMVAR
ncbi:hypothetical protein EMCRGX_G017623 [Ephydatia muelleri]